MRENHEKHEKRWMSVSVPCLLLVGMVFLAAGCGKKSGPEESSQKGGKSAGRLAIDGFTGRQAVKSGQKARKTIEDVSRKKGNDLEDVLGK